MHGAVLYEGKDAARKAVATFGQSAVRHNGHIRRLCLQMLRTFTRGIMVQTVGELEDVYDGEGMMQTEARHKAHFSDMHRALRNQGVTTLALGAECCMYCAECTYPDTPCRFPTARTVSMEAYGLLVLEVCRANGLAYYYGPERIAYTSCFLFE